MFIEAIIAVALLSIGLVFALTSQWHALQKAQQAQYELITKQLSYNLALMPSQKTLSIPLPQGKLIASGDIQWWDPVTHQLRVQGFP